MPANGPARIPSCFNVVDFNDGGIESSLMQWLRIFDRSRFAVTLVGDVRVAGVREAAFAR